MYKILKVTRMCVSSMRMEDCGTHEADQAVTRGAKAVTQGVVVNFSQMSNRHFGLPRCKPALLNRPKQHPPEHTVLVTLLSSNRSLVTYHPLFYPSRFGKIRHERIAMLFRRGIRASALLERYKMGRVTSCARSSQTLERACKKK